MNRLLKVARTQLCLVAAGATIAFPLASCTGRSASSDTSSNAASQGSAGSNASANAGGSPTAGRRRFAQALMGIGLSDEQKSEIRALMRATRKENANADPETRRANYKAAMAKIDALLSPDQRVKLHAKLGNMRNGRGESAPAQS